MNPDYFYLQVEPYIRLAKKPEMTINESFLVIQGYLKHVGGSVTTPTEVFTKIEYVRVNDLRKFERIITRCSNFFILFDEFYNQQDPY